LGDEQHAERQRAWIPMFANDEITPELRDVYEQFGVPTDEIDHILAIHSLSPASLRAHLDLYRTLMYGPSPLTRPERETIAVTVSTLNECHY